MTDRPDADATEWARASDGAAKEANYNAKEAKTNVSGVVCGEDMVDTAPHGRYWLLRFVIWQVRMCEYMYPCCYQRTQIRY